MLTQLNKTWEGVSKRLEAVQVKSQISKVPATLPRWSEEGFPSLSPGECGSSMQDATFCQFRMLWRSEATSVSLCVPQAFALGKLLDPIFATDVGGKFLPPCPPMSTID